jgi:hypothetical protein
MTIERSPWQTAADQAQLVTFGAVVGLWLGCLGATVHVVLGGERPEHNMELACLSLEELGFSETVYETTKPQQQQPNNQQHRGKGRQQQLQAEDACDRDARSV